MPTRAAEQRQESVMRFESPERVGFEPTWLAPIRFRGGAVMTASVPLLISFAILPAY